MDATIKSLAKRIEENNERRYALRDEIIDAMGHCDPEWLKDRMTDLEWLNGEVLKLVGQMRELVG